MAALLRTVVADQTGGGATTANPVVGRHGGGGSGSGDSDESRWTQRQRPQGGQRRQVLGAEFLGAERAASHTTRENSFLPHGKIVFK